MKAAVIKGPGVVVVEEVPTPRPGDGEVLLKIEACALCGTDQRVLTGEKHVDVPIVGHEITGRVAGVGHGARGAKEGDRFAVQTVIGCGRCAMCRARRENLCEQGFKAIGYQYNGGFAEYAVMPRAAVEQGCLIPIPESLPAEVGTLIEPLSCCVNGMAYMPLESMGHVVVFGGGIIGVLNALVARARGARRLSIMDVSPQRLELLKRLGLPFDDLVNTRESDPVEWVKAQTAGRGVDGVVVAASAKALVALGMRLLARGGHISIFAGMPKSDSVDAVDLNPIHYRELNVHGANSSARDSYIQARDLIVSGRIAGAGLVTHVFRLAEFRKAFDAQRDPASGALKVVVVP
jgi:L-iditol 2-dehydrogenase